jgi:HlyD family secretion protein
VQSAVADQDAARAREEAARSEQRAAQAALIGLPVAGNAPAANVRLASPVSGRVLRVAERSERTVAAGTPVMIIGDPSRFEIVADVLSTEAVKIRPGAPARLEEWGGDKSLRAVVRLVEPYAFTKVSALGVEEQRVNVILDPVDPLGALGDGYRVEARIVVWSAADVLQVPSSALFRSGDRWMVFTVEDGRARRRQVEAGARNPYAVEIVSGLDAGATVIRYPGNELSEGMLVTPVAR